MVQVRLGTRGSALALQQAALANQAFMAVGMACLIETWVTTGDAIRNVPLYDLGGKGLFCRELDQALLDGRIDVAVHSLKDVPADLPEGLELAAILERADTRDVLVSRDGQALHELPVGSRIGTCSLRRQAQLRVLRPDITVVPLRGNVPTRLQKVTEGQVDAAVLALAGIERLGQKPRIAQIFTREEMLPAVGQGAIALVTRVKDQDFIAACQRVGDATQLQYATTERAMLHTLNGSCRTPVAGLASGDGKQITLSALIADPEGRQVFRTTATGSASQPESIGRQAATALAAQAGQGFLERIGCAIIS